MIALAADQESLMQSSSVGLVTLVHLTTYTDRVAGTVSREFWFSTPHPIRYEWGGGSAQDFLDVIDSVSYSGDGFDHLPSAGGLRGASASVNLVAETLEGVNLWKTLSAEILHRATVEIATLLVNPAQYQAVAWWDLTALAGTEHVVRFRGVLSGSAEVSDEIIRLAFETDAPPIPWLRATDADETDPKDLGRRYPIPFGTAHGVPCVSRVVGWYTTLAEPIAADRTGNTAFSDLSGAPSGSKTYQLGSERITATKVDAKTLNITARGTLGTSALPHNVGEPLIEHVTEVVLVVAGTPIASVDALYVINQSSGERIHVRTPYTVSRLDTDVDLGEVVTSIRFNASEWQQLLDSLVPETPAESGGLETELVVCSLYSEDTTSIASIQCNAISGSKRVEYSSTLHDKLRATVQAGDLPASPTRVISRWRVRVDCDGRGEDTVDNPDETIFRHDVSVAGTTNPGTELLYTFDDGVEEAGLVLYGPWHTPATTKTLNDLSGGFVQVWCDVTSASQIYGTPTAGENYVDISQIRIEAEVIPAAGADEPSATNSGASQAGFGMLFVADVKGVGVPPDSASWSSGYTFNEGTGWNLGSGVTQTDLGASGQQFDLTGGTDIKVAQRNATAGTVDLSSPDLGYRVTLTVTNVGGLNPSENAFAVAISFSNTVGSGTSIPGDARVIYIRRSSLIEATEVQVEVTAFDSGDPGTDNVETIHLDFSQGDGNGSPVTVVVKSIERTGVTNADWGSRSVGELLTEGHDIARWFIEEMAGEEFDATSLSAMDTALGGVAFAGQYDAYGETLSEVMAGLGFDMRTNFRRSPIDGNWRALAATHSGSTYTYPAVVRTLATLDTLREALKDLPDLAHSFRGFFALDRWLPPTTADSFRGLAVEEASAALAALGPVEADPFLFLGIEEEATASDVLGFFRYYRGTVLGYRRWTLTVPIWDGYDLEPGDTVALRPRWRDADAKARVLEVILMANEAAVGLVLEEVL